MVLNGKQDRGEYGKAGQSFLFLFFVTLGQSSDGLLFPDWGSNEGKKIRRSEGRKYGKREGTEEGITYG